MIFFGDLKTLSSDLTSRGHKGGDEAIRELFCTFVEEGKLDEEIAEQILQRILEILFGEKADRSSLRQFQEKERKHI